MGGPSGSTIRKQNDIAQAQVNLATQQDQRAQQLYDLTFPGEKKAEDYYTKLASGDPNQLQQALAPAIGGITSSANQAQKSILDYMPKGGQQLLALEENQIQKASNIGQLESQAYTSSFPALASLGSQGIGLSINQVANAVSALGGASHTTAAVGQEQAAGKATTLGFIGSLAGAGASAAGAGAG